MTTNIKLKRSAVDGNIPTTGQLDLGEIAINTFNGTIFIKKDNGAASIISFPEVTTAFVNSLNVDATTLDGLDSLAFATAVHTHTAANITDFDTEVSNNSAVALNTAKATNATHTGDVTGSTALTIAADAVNNFKLANMVTASIKGRVSAGTGDPEDLSAGQVSTFLGLGTAATTAATAYLASTGGTLTGDLIVNGPSGGVGGWNKPIQTFVPTLPNGERVQFAFGRNAATSNMVEHTFHYVSSGSATNHYSMGFYDNTTRLVLQANGRLSLGFSYLTPDFTEMLNVSGNIKVTGLVDGRDVAADGTKLDGITTGDVALGTGTSGNYIATGAVSGSGLSGSATGEGSTFTVTSNATSLNTASTLVFRDASGNFSAGTITGALAGNATTATNVAATGVTAGNLISTVLPFATASATASAFKVPFLNTTGVASGNFGLLHDTSAHLTYNPSTNNLATTTFTGALAGNATTATAWATGRTITLTGDVTGVSAAFSGSGNLSFVTTIAPNSVALGADTTGDYVTSVAGTTNEIEVTGSGGETAAVTIGLPNDVTITNNLTVGNNVLLDDYTLSSATSTLATITETAITTFSATTYGGGKFIITAKNGVNRHIVELLVTHDGTTAIATQYGDIVTSVSLATYNVDISAGNVRILVTGASASSTIYKVQQTLMLA
jgi:hypothetical protein